MRRLAAFFLPKPEGQNVLGPKRFAAHMTRVQTGVPVKRLASVWLGSVLIIAAGYLHPSMAQTASDPGQCFLWAFLTEDETCEVYAASGYKSCGRCVWSNDEEPIYTPWAPADQCPYDAGSSLGCQWIPEEENCWDYDPEEDFECLAIVWDCAGLIQCPVPKP